MSSRLNIVVLYGGDSPEAEVSRGSGNAVSAALKSLGHDVELVEVHVDNLLRLASAGYDCAWLATHGAPGEDGTLQGFLEMIKLPYTGSGVAASSLSMDKVLSRKLVRSSSMRQPKYFPVNLATVDHCTLPEDWQYPIIVKPAAGGSSVAVTLVQNAEQLQPAIYDALAVDDVAMVEQYLQGRELSVGVFEGQVLGDVEIKPAGAFYDYEAKYESSTTEYILNPEMDDVVRRALHDQALEASQLFGCEGAIRIDFFLVGHRDLYFMEINTIPGMTETSLLPKIAESDGISFADLVERIAFQARLKCS